MAEKKENRIGNSTMVVMGIVAFLFDALEVALLAIFGIGLILNRLVVIIKWWIFWFWFGAHDVPFGKLNSKDATRRFITMSITMIVGFIPGLGALPEFTFGIIILGILVRAEDKTGISASKIESLKRGRSLRRNALNDKEGGGGGSSNRTPKRAQSGAPLEEAFGTT